LKHFVVKVPEDTRQERPHPEHADQSAARLKGLDAHLESNKKVDTQSTATVARIGIHRFSSCKMKRPVF
jgi:hypothetical protein